MGVKDIESFNMNFMHLHITCGDNEQWLNSKVQSKITGTERTGNFKKIIRGRIRCYGEMGILC